MSSVVANIAARIERLPVSRWHAKAAAALGTATFFDGFDALTIAYIMPVLAKAWSLSPIEIGMMIGVGYAGQAIGALLFGWAAERWGRIGAIRVAVVIIGVMSLVCAMAQNFPQLALARLIQGVGLGGEVPVAAAYLNEIVRAKDRGRIFYIYQSTFGVGVIVAAGTGAILTPTVGWQSMFVLGALPAILALFLQGVCPESPRWLASKGRIEAAEQSMARIERGVSRGGTVALPPVEALVEAPSPPAARWSDLFSGVYLRRTVAVCVLWIIANGCIYGLGTWMPTLLTGVYKLPLRQALSVSFGVNVVGLVGSMSMALAADRVSRRALLAAGLFMSGLPVLVLWSLHGAGAGPVILLAGTSIVVLGLVTSTLYLYTPELYPTGLRTLGTGFGSFCLRMTTIGAPVGVGALVQHFGPPAVFLAAGGAAVLGGAFAWLSALDTRGAAYSA